LQGANPPAASAEKTRYNAAKPSCPCSLFEEITP
jgi:hypothetical protein